MRFIRRNRPAPQTCDHQRMIDWLRAQQARQREQDEADRADLIARLSTRYYAAHAIVADDHARGIVGSNGHLIGVCSGLIEALAEATGINSITVGFRLERGIPVTENWVAVCDYANGIDPGPMVLLHDGLREPVVQRLDRLHREALKVTGHPMYQVLYGSTPA